MRSTPEQALIVQTDDQREQAIEREVQRRVADALSEAPDLMERAVERGLRKVIEDPEVQRRYWQRGYEEFERHAGQNLAQALGRRIILFVVTAAVGMALAWSWIIGRPSS